ncbi:MAG: polyphosphate polymerase domain-containing protein [Clostridia bacterium]|nr:polyphosphate polymerase domain-containing protein [Clostridia bacterium]
MAKRHEEKYIISYAQYVMLRARAEAAMERDANSRGAYTISSLYYDDIYDSALDEKLDGIREHTKFRVRTYGFSSDFVRLEKKIKTGIITEKISARISADGVDGLSSYTDVGEYSEKAYGLICELRSKGLRPSIIVRYKRDAFVHVPTNTRLTFDREIEALPSDSRCLYDGSLAGVPALPRGQVIMEVKYDDRLPAFVRKLSNCPCQQLSVSKYALCREALR